MTSRPRLSIFVQLTLLAVLTAGGVALFSYWINTTRGLELLTEQAVQDLQDKTNLRLFEVEGSIVRLARDLRTLASNIGRYVREKHDITSSKKKEEIEQITPTILREVREDPGFARRWNQQCQALLDSLDTSDLTASTPSLSPAIRDIDLVYLPPGQSEFVARTSLWADGQRTRPRLQTARQPFTDREAIARMRQELRDWDAGDISMAKKKKAKPASAPQDPPGQVGQHPLGYAVDFRLEGPPGSRRCILTLTRRLGVSKIPLFVVMNIDINTYFFSVASIHPLNRLFLLNGDGVYLHHPVPAMIGTQLTPDELFRHFPRAGWGDPNQDRVAQDLLLTRGVRWPEVGTNRLQGDPIPGVSYYSARASLTDEDRDVLELQASKLRAEDQNLHCSTITRFSRRIYISHPKQVSLREACRRLEVPASAWSSEVDCRHFVAHMVPLIVPLGGDPDPIRLVMTASTEEIRAEIFRNLGITRLLALAGLIALAALFAIGLAYYVTRPLRGIVQAAELLGEGNYAVDLPDGGPHEVARLSSAFRAMLTQLRQRDARLRETLGEVQTLNNHLDIKVRERTLELQESLAKLEVALEQARAASRAKDTFVANMSHELRQPLHIIIGFTEALREEGERFNQPGLIPDLDKILTAARHLLGLINDILDMAKVSAGKMELTPTDFQVATLVKNLQTLIDPLVVKNNNRLVAHVAEDAGTMKADEKRVTQVLLDLLSNACKFTRDGEVTLSVTREMVTDCPWMRFSVRDTGKGMTAEQVKKLFSRFYQVDDSTRREQGGTGLGLAITKSLCDLMGATVDVTSEPGKGSEFVVRIPTVPPVRPDSVMLKAPVSVHTRKEGAQKTSRVLVIDDDPAVCDLMKRFLTKQGFEVETAPNGEDGLKLARTIRPDIITLDVMMPGIDGWATLAALKTDSVTRDIPVVMVTIVDDQSRGYSLGATDYVTKPLDWNRLGTLLQHHVDRQGAAGPVLVIDDEPDSREMIKRMLGSRGREVVTAANGKEGLEMFKARPPAVVLLDLMMPVMDGFEFLAEMRKLDPENKVPVIVITAKDLTAEDAQKLNGGVAHVLQKGNPQQLEQIIQQIRARL